MTILTVFVLYCGGEITHYKQKTMGPFCPLSCFTSKYNSPFTQSLSLSLSLSLPFSLSAFSFSCSLEDRVMHNKGTHSLTHVQCNCPTVQLPQWSLSLNNTANKTWFLMISEDIMSNCANVTPCLSELWQLLYAVVYSEHVYMHSNMLKTTKNQFIGLHANH